MADEYPQTTPWVQLPGAAVTIAAFTTPVGFAPNPGDISPSPTASDVVQTLWALTTSGDLYALQSQWSDPFHPQWGHIPFPEKAVWISDGAVLGQSGILYFCYTWQCFSGYPQPGDWVVAKIYPTTNYGAPVQLKQVATGGVISQAVIGGPPFQTINSLPPYSPIAWGIDYQGNIYFAQFISFGEAQ